LVEAQAAAKRRGMTELKAAPTSEYSWPFLDAALSFEVRARDIVSRLTTQEKIAQMLHEAPAVERLGIPPHNYWNECLHGVARAGVATVFPQAIGLAAMFNENLMFEVASAISDEARAKHHDFASKGDYGYYKGLTYWSPNINIFRDPRWGRGHETYGECPFLTARLGVAFCKGLQGDDEKYLKLVATPKHFAVHSGPEGLRHKFDAQVSDKDLWETYLPAFEACVIEAKAASVMGAYNRTNGEPCCASPTLLQRILRERWGFQGYVVSDCWAIRDFHTQHHVTKTPAESAALAVRVGCDLNCGCTYPALVDALAEGIISEAEIDRSVERLFLARLRLGMFEPKNRVKYADLPYSLVDCDRHRELALEAARQSIVLLKNQNSILPLSKDLRSIAVIGPNADAPDVLKANYSGTPPFTVTPLEGIRQAVSKQTRVLYTEGCNHTGLKEDAIHADGSIIEAVSRAAQADVCVLVLGLSTKIEGEEGDTSNPDWAGDKPSLELLGLQPRLLEAVCALGKPVVLVVMSGSPLAINWAHEHVPGIVQVFYAGQSTGTALAEVLFGDCSPAGRLPVTYPRSLEQLPEFTDYSMQGRTYRYLSESPLYPFGYGLSYTTFEYSEIALDSTCIDTQTELQLSVDVKNIGLCAGDEVVQLYVSDLTASVRVPTRELRGFQRIHLAPGASQRVTFKLTPKMLALVDESGTRVLEPGAFLLTLGGSQADERSIELTQRAPKQARFEVIGPARRF